MSDNNETTSTKVTLALMEERIHALQSQVKSFKDKYVDRSDAARTFDTIERQIARLELELKELEKNTITKDQIATLKWIGMTAGGVIIGLVIQGFLK